MANPPMDLNIDAHAVVTPRGDQAQMSRTGAGNLPNQAVWHAAGDGCTVTLPVAVWDVNPDQGKNTYTLSIPKGKPSRPFTLKTTAPIGEQLYAVHTDDRGLIGDTQPTVVVNP